MSLHAGSARRWFLRSGVTGTQAVQKRTESTMTESYEQFVARTSSKSSSLPVWGSALVFLTVYRVLQMGYGACRGSWFEHLVTGELTVVPSAALIGTLTPEVGVKALGNQLIASGGGIVVKKGCEGTEVMFMLIAAFATVSMPWRRLLAGLGLGLLLVFCLNQLRLVGLFCAYCSDPNLFGLLYGTLAPIALVLAVTLYTLYWFQSAREPVRSSASAAA
jgi:exosortase/archaeosortase family protein